MEFKITKEQIDELARINAVIKERLNEYFPEAFKIELEKGKWYKHTLYNYLFCFNGKYADNSQYGIAEGGKWVTNASSSRRHLDSFELATEEEIFSALEKEAIKRYGEDWKNAKIERCLYHGKPGMNSGSLIPLINIGDKQIWNRNACIFHDGIWTEPLKEKTPAPTEKTVISLKKALKILAKKLKVSPENIEIE